VRCKPGSFWQVLLTRGASQASQFSPFASAQCFLRKCSVVSMIGYGEIVPRTDAGKIGTIVYAVFGIPVYILYFMNMGKVLAQFLKWVYTKAYRWNVRRKWRKSLDYSQGEDAELDEAFLDEMERQVEMMMTTLMMTPFAFSRRSSCLPRLVSTSWSPISSWAPSCSPSGRSGTTSSPFTFA